MEGDFPEYKPARSSVLGRLREAYRIKGLTNTSFRATVVAVTVVLVALAVVTLLFFTFKNTGFDSDSDPSWFMKSN
jgi:hypothetical protein